MPCATQLERRQAARWAVARGMCLWSAAGAAPVRSQAPGLDPAPMGQASAPVLPARLGPELRQWVARHTVRFAPERDYGPFCFQQPDGQVAGLAVDMLRAVQASTGLRLHIGPAAPLADMLVRAQAREVDLLPALRPTPERARFLGFSRPYAAIPAVLVQRQASTPGTLADLAGQVVAVGKGYAVEAEVRRRHPTVRWLALPDDQQVLQALAQQQAAGAVLDLASLGFLQQRHAWPPLQVAAAVGFEYLLSFAARSDWPELVAVLDAGIRAIDAAQRRRLVQRWLPAAQPLTEPVSGPGTRQLGWGLLALAATTGLGLAWRARHGARGQGVATARAANAVPASAGPADLAVAAADADAVDASGSPGPSGPAAGGALVAEPVPPHRGPR